MSYEYKVLQFGHGMETNSAKQFEDILNELGADGWKVVASGGAGGESSQFGFREGWIILMRD